MDSLYIVIFALLVLVIIPGMLRRRRLERFLLPRPLGKGAKRN